MEPSGRCILGWNRTLKWWPSTSPEMRRPSASAQPPSAAMAGGAAAPWNLCAEVENRLPDPAAT